MNIQGFLNEVESIYQTGAATEHSYRADLQELLSSIAPDVTALNEPKRVKCGAPDFIVSQGDIAIGHVEAKNIPIGIRGLKDSNKDQQKRYLAALPNLIYTNCLDWDFYRDSELVASVSIADFLMGVQPRPQDFATLENLLREFVTQRPQTITSPRDLAERMAGKANLIKDVLGKTLREDAEFQTELYTQYQAFQENLIHDITTEDFADIYAETIAYGMFAARLHDQTLDTFSRQEALELLPKSNPFLRSLFSYVAGYDLDDRIAWIIDDLARVFQACDVAKIMEGFGKLTGQNDPFLHFYETFLAAYNPSKRRARGVWYTPEPVVNFIVRAVDEVLQTEFGLPDGLADTSKVTIDWDTGQKAMTKAGKLRKDGKNAIGKREVHRVQILDPATGTGTFLAEVIKQIAPRVQGVAPAMWSKYIEDDLIPRLHGFELLMASYAMCHMKVDMILTELGYKPKSSPPRLSVYLTNSLEEGEPANQTLPFTQWLSREAKGANVIKRDMPIMCVIGNPPYAGQSSNKGEWIDGLMREYKLEPGGKIKLQERNPKWVNNDYVKFICLGEHLVKKSGEGVVSFITSNSYLESPTFRGMRWRLLSSFSKIYILNLHGDSNISEKTPDGNRDRNVFDIMEGVSIIIAIAQKDHPHNNELCDAFYFDVWGERKSKYRYLEKEAINSILWKKLEPKEPYYFLKFKGNMGGDKYQEGFSIADLFVSKSTGYYTSADQYVIGFQRNAVLTSVKGILSENENPDDSFVRETTFRPLDNRMVYYDPSILSRSRKKFVEKLPYKNGLVLLSGKSTKGNDINHFFVSSTFSELKCAESTKGSYMLPVYLQADGLNPDKAHRVNFDLKLLKRLQKLADHPTFGTPDEVAIFDYIYGVLYCPAYRQIYAEFLKIDFPRIPWPTTTDEFWDVATKGAELRKLHLMEAASIGATPYPFTGEGDNEVDKPRFEDGRVWINDSQFFAAAPAVSWDFYIGGYQPAQKWLKDRKGRALSFADVQHYQRILKILSETDRIMHTIEMAL